MTYGKLFLAATILIGAALRCVGLDWGLPWGLHIDERLFVVAKSIQMEAALARGELPDPGISSYGTLPLWLLVAARAVFLDVVASEGPPTYSDEFAATIWIGRWISALWGVVTIGLVWLWARRFGTFVAGMAAALTAGFPALVQSSHFSTVESPLVALIVAGVWASERLAERRTTGRTVSAGAILGLALSVKAPGGVVMLPILHALLSSGWRSAVKPLMIVVGVALTLVVALNPAPLFAERASLGEHETLGGNLARAYSRDFHDWTLPYANDRPLWTEVTKLLPYSIGWGAELAAVLGLLIVLRRRSASDVRLLLVLAPILLLLVPASVKTVRFLVPALPALAIVAAIGIQALRERVPRMGSGVAVLVGALTLLQGTAFSQIYVREDARISAARWLDEHVGAREVVAIEDPPGYGPPIGSVSREWPRPRHRIEILWAGFYAIHEKRSEEEREAHLDRILRRADYLVLSEGHREEFTTSDLRPVEKNFYAQLDAGQLPFERVVSFKNYPRLGPWIWNDDRAEVLMRVFDHPRIEIWKRSGE